MPGSVTRVVPGRSIAGFLVGAFVVAGASTAQCANTWLQWGSGTDNVVTAVATLGNGDIVAGGAFSTAGGAGASCIARWNGGGWSPLGSGLQGSGFAWVNALATMPNGDLVAGGVFTVAGGVNASYIARWDGTAWTPLGAGVTGWVYALTVLPNGDLVVGGSFGNAGGANAPFIARWDGTTWSSLGTGVNGTVLALTTLANGDVVAGGTFTVAGGVSANCLARWNGSSWSALDTAEFRNYVAALTTMPNGDIVSAEGFADTSGNGLHRVAVWNGTTWSMLGSLMNQRVWALRVLPNGDVVAGGSFTVAGGVGANHIARWNGSTWSAFGVGTNSYVSGLTSLPNGDLVVGGYFTTAGGATSDHMARLTTTCPATAVSSGAGCAGSGGSNTLVANTLPWVDTTFRATGTGLPAPSYVLSVYGLSPVVPAFAIDSAFPAALPGCNLHVTPDGIETLFTATGTVQSQVFLPNTPPLVGVSFYHQMLPVVLSAGVPIEITATNALHLTAGSF